METNSCRNLAKIESDSPDRKYERARLFSLAPNYTPSAGPEIRFKHPETPVWGRPQLMRHMASGSLVGSFWEQMILGVVVWRGARPARSQGLTRTKTP